MKKRRILKKVYLTQNGETVTASSDLHKAVDEFVFVEKEGSTEWLIKHDLETTGIVYSLFDDSNRIIIPNSFKILNSNEVSIQFSMKQKGKAFLIGNVVE